jgi:hypothetical protein
MYGSSAEDQRQTLRRTTLDLQDWANWRHQQTVQQLQKLKEESNGKQSQECQWHHLPFLPFPDTFPSPI